MSDRIEKLAKEYAERTIEAAEKTAIDLYQLPDREDLIAAFRAGAAAGRAEAHTQRSPQVEGEA